MLTIFVRQRLGGNSLLDVVIFGRVAGKHAVEVMLGASVKATNLRHQSGENTRQAIVVGDALTSAGAATKTRAKMGIPDSVELFTAATPKGGAKETRSREGVLW